MWGYVAGYIGIYTVQDRKCVKDWRVRWNSNLKIQGRVGFRSDVWGLGFRIHWWSAGNRKREALI